MKKLSLISFLTLCLGSFSYALTFDFESYSDGNLVGQPSSGTQWENALGSSPQIVVAAGAGVGGSKGITTGSPVPGNSNFVFNDFKANNTDLGLTFNANSTVLQYSFQWRPTQELNSSSATEIFRFAVGLDTSAAGNDPAMQIGIRSNNSLFVVTRGPSETWVASNLFTLNQWATISGTINYGSNTYTVFVDDTQLFTDDFTGGNIPFRVTNLENAFIRLGNINAGSGSANYRTWTADNISIIPEPRTYALMGGVLVLAVALLRRRRRV
jgi:hypothetical protein